MGTTNPKQNNSEPKTRVNGRNSDSKFGQILSKLWGRKVEQRTLSTAAAADRPGSKSIYPVSGFLAGFSLTCLFLGIAVLATLESEQAGQQAALENVDFRMESVINSATAELSRITALTATIVRDNSSQRTKGDRVISPGIFDAQISPLMQASPFINAAVFMPRVIDYDQALFEAASYAKGLAQYQPVLIPGAQDAAPSFFPVRYVLWSPRFNDPSSNRSASLFPKSVIAGEEVLRTLVKIVEIGGNQASGLIVRPLPMDEFGSLPGEDSGNAKTLIQSGSHVFWLMSAVRDGTAEVSPESGEETKTVDTVIGVFGLEISLDDLLEASMLPEGVVVDIVRTGISPGDSGAVIKRFEAPGKRNHWLAEAIGYGPLILKRDLGFPGQDLSVVISAHPRAGIFSGYLLPFALLGGIIVTGAIFLHTRRVSGIARKSNAGRSDIEKRVEEQRRILAANDAQFSHLIESTNVVAWAADLNTKRFTYVGPQVKSLTGYSPSTWYSHGFWIHHVHPDDRDRVLHDLDELEVGSFAVREYRLRKSDGSIVWVRNSITATQTETSGTAAKPETGPRQIQGFLIDITDQKKAQIVLRRAKETAEQSNRAKSEFLANMSHELRTPLNSIIGFAEIMEGQLLGPLGNDRYKEYVVNIQSSGRHLLDLINDILDLSKIESGRFELQEAEVDLLALLKSSYSLLRERAKKAGIHFSLSVEPDLPDLFGDGRRTKQILLNLLSNAIKFTNPGGSVSLEAKLVKGGGLSLSVIDTGIGLLPEEIPLALQKFSQIDSSLARKHDGSGLGLPIAKSLAELHGGSLKLESNFGQGTRVTIWMPENRLLWEETEPGNRSADRQRRTGKPENRQVA